MKAVELFAGAGGLALGMRLAGFDSLAIVEWDQWACDTIRENRSQGHPLVAAWPEPFEGDVRHFEWDALANQVDVVAGGPPCQPFSMGGKHRAYDDARDLFPVAVDVIRRLKPRAFVLENVKGLTRAAFDNYVQYIQSSFSCATRSEWSGVARTGRHTTPDCKRLPRPTQATHCNTA